MAESFVIQPQIGDVKGPTSGIYGICIAQGTSDPTARVTYVEDAVGMNPLSVNQSTGVCDYGDWEDIINEAIGCKPCLYSNGSRSVYLDPTNYAKTASGSTADITSGSAGDVMIEFSKCWYRWRESGSNLYFEFTSTDKSGESGWYTTAFKTQNGGDADYFYYGAYDGYELSNKLRSLSGKTPTVNKTIGAFRTLATANGTKYQQEEIAKRYYIIGLIFTVIKSCDAQSIIGMGNVSGRNAAINTGTMDTSGLFYGTSNKQNGVKAFGIENFWGNIWKWCDGFVSGGSGALKYKAYGPYNDAGTNYSSVSGIPTNQSYVTALTALNGDMLVGKTAGGSNTTYYPDCWGLGSSASSVCCVGGDWSSDLNAGPLYCYVYYSASDAYASFGGRLVAA